MWSGSSTTHPGEPQRDASSRKDCSCASIGLSWRSSSALRLPIVAAQQRPLATEDPEVIGAGRLLIEGGIDAAHDQHYPLSGLRATCGACRCSASASASAQSPRFRSTADPSTLSRSPRESPRRSRICVTVTGNSTHDVEDIVIGTKVRLLAEAARHPSLGFRFATRLPNARNESGLGLDTTDFFASLARRRRRSQSIRVVGNIGVGHSRRSDRWARSERCADLRRLGRAGGHGPERGGRRAQRAESTRETAPFPGTETRGALNIGGRYTRGIRAVRRRPLLRADQRRPDCWLLDGLHLRLPRVQRAIKASDRVRSRAFSVCSIPPECVADDVRRVAERRIAVDTRARQAACVGRRHPRASRPFHLVRHEPAGHRRSDLTSGSGSSPSGRAPPRSPSLATIRFGDALGDGTRGRVLRRRRR